MKNGRKALLELLTVKTEKVKLECLKNTNLKDMEFQLKEMNITQNKRYREILKKRDVDSLNEAMKFSCGAVMVDPAFFTDEEFENLNGIGELIMNEIFYKIPTIGMSEEEKKHFSKKMIETAKTQIQKESKDDNLDLIKSYKNDKNIVDKLRSDDLKSLCEYLDIKYTNATAAKKALKSNKPLEEKESKEREVEAKK